MDKTPSAQGQSVIASESDAKGRLRVAFVSRCPKDFDQPRGGVETATVALARALRATNRCELFLLAVEQGGLLRKKNTSKAFKWFACPPQGGR